MENEIELLIPAKERIRKGGKSIYKNPKETISIWGSYSILKNKLNCSIPEKPDLELIHKKRNSIQHRYSNLSPEDTVFYIDCSIKFIKRFLNDELNLKIENYFPVGYFERVL